MKNSLKNINLQGQKVLLRVDFNVPLSADGKVLDSERLVRVLPTIRYLLERGTSIILMSHLGRPQKKLLPDGSIDIHRFSLRNLLPTLEELLQQKIQFSADCGGPESKIMAADLRSGDILLLENTRFDKGETKGDEQFAKSLADLGMVYINDAFGTAHRAHASTAVIAQYFDDEHKGIGLLIEEELTNARKVLREAQHPFVLIMGGAKISDKIPLIEHFLGKADHIIIGGGMAYTFIKAQGGQIGGSLVEESYLELARSLLDKARKAHVGIWLPEDSVVADNFDSAAQTKIVPSGQIDEGWMGLDIGPESSRTYSELLHSARTILWNGPMGVFEMKPFQQGTLNVAKAIAKAIKAGAYSLIGGGDSASAIKQLNYGDQVSYISTGGGAMLTLLEGNPMPGLTAISPELI